MQGRVQIPVKRNRRQQCRIREVPQKNELDENWQSSWNTNRQSCVQWLRWQSCASSASVNGYAGSANCVAPSGTGLMRPKTCRRSNRQLRKKPSTWKMNLLSRSTTTSSSSFSSSYYSGLAANCRSRRTAVVNQRSDGSGNPFKTGHLAANCNFGRRCGQGQLSTSETRRLPIRSPPAVRGEGQSKRLLWGCR